MKTINCPACGARMTLINCKEGHISAAWHHCDCGLRTTSHGAATHRGAAIKAGRAMRRWGFRAGADFGWWEVL